MKRDLGAASRGRLIAAASGLALLAGGWSAAMAQEAGAAAGDVGELVVTASRVRQLGFQAPTPTTILGAEDIRKTGITNIGQLSTQIPQFIASESPSNSAVRSGGGGSVFNLRGLTAPRTLFLVNSRRHVPNNPNGTTDNNVVPSSIVERVDVVTGGASAAWGSDAVAGVVNVILRKEIDGLEASMQYGGTSHGDNQEFKGSAAWGARFGGGRGRFMIAGEYADNNGIPNVSDRDWARANWGVVANPNYTATNGQFQRILSANTHVNNATYGGLITSGVLAGTQFGNGGVPLSYNAGLFPAGSSGSIGGEGPNLNLGLNLMVPIERYTVYTRTSYDITDNVTLFVEGTIAQSKTDYELIDNFNFGNITINADNAFLPASLRAAMVAAGQTSFQMGRVNADFGGIHDYNQNATRRGVIGLEGKFGKDWTWNTYYQFGDNREVTNETPIVKPANLNLAVDAVFAPNGQVACRSTLTNPGNGCVPINLFGVGSPSAQSVRYVTGLGHRLTVYQQHAASFSVAGPLFSTWAGPIAVAAGADYRRDTLRRRVDADSQANNFLIGNPKNIDGRISVKEVFGEAVIPLAKDMPLIKSLELDLADRFVDYSTTGSVNSWKVGLNYQVTDELRLRATRSRDIRAPNANELFAFGGTQFAAIRDPVTGRTSQVPIINAPNPSLGAEKADTTTFGVVYEPKWLPRFRISVDHYKIDIRGAIVTIPAQDFVDRCAAGNQALCQVIQRNAAGDITQIQAGRVNLSQLLNSGVDFEAAYSLPIASLFKGQSGELSFRGLATYLHENITNDGRTKIDRAGVVLDGQPHWRANGMVTYSAGPLDVYANIRYVGGGVYNKTYTAQSLNIQDFFGQTTVALGFQYTLKPQSSRPIQIYGLVSNVFDQAPPIIPDQQQQATMTNFALYDTIGRSFMLGARIKY